MKLQGKVHKYGANVDTDVIIPGPYLTLSEPAELAKHCMEGIDSEFLQRVQPGDIIVADTNFGCGSSREHAAIAIKAAGISCVIAKSFARIFYRNALNIGLPLLECDDAAEKSDAGDTLEVELATGEIRNLTRGLVFKAKPYPEFMLDLLSAGGLIEYTKRRLFMTWPTDNELWNRIEKLKGETIHANVRNECKSRILDVTNHGIRVLNLRNQKQRIVSRQDLIFLYHLLQTEGILAERNIPSVFFQHRCSRIVLAILAKTVPKEIEIFRRGEEPRFPTLSGIRRRECTSK